ncbi:MAG: chemotaxis protein CheA [Phycisphaerales bacterium]|nr:chemotaxis protein CheA [Phycisphaerales bacterium]
MAELNFDPELMQDFLTESGELLDQLDQDLVLLESTPEDLELLNRIFRALHTIKGSASFLALTNLVSIAHAAEGALNAARNRVFVVDRAAMDYLLSAVDVIKAQFANIRAGQELVLPDANLVARLTALGEGKGAGASHAGHDAPAKSAAAVRSGDSGDNAPAPGMPMPPAQPADSAGGLTEKPLELSSSKADLLEFLVEDVEQTLAQIESQIARLTSDPDRPAAGSAIAELGESLTKSAEFFDFEPMQRLAKCLVQLGEQAGTLQQSQIAGAVPDAQRVVSLLREQKGGLAQKKLVSRPIDDLVGKFSHLEDFPAAQANAPTSPTSSTTNAGSATSATTNEPRDAATNASVNQGSSGLQNAQNAAGNQAANSSQAAGVAQTAGSDQTIRVEVSRLEALLNLVGELVLQKNRVSAVARQVAANAGLAQNLREQASEVSSSLDRVTSDLQVAVMKTRMQPLEKLFGKYPRLIRDLARKLNKQINLEIEGANTEVDKSVIEELGDPLVHLMRNSADHGIEPPDVRRSKGKSEAGTIRLVASNAGGHVQILIIDDGKGIDPEFISRKAMEKGIVTQQQIAAMTDREKMGLIFAPGFSTAEQISDVSGRGVGMDVVKTNIEKLKGTIEIDSEVGKGTTMRVKIPLTVAILSAMMVGVGDEIYAVPLTSITEIVKPEPAQLASINRFPVMRLRNSVLPLLSAAELFGAELKAQALARAASTKATDTTEFKGADGKSIPVPEGEATPENPQPFAVVLVSGDKRVGLQVTRLIGQQEVVIKPLDRFLDKGGPVSGATVRDDGGVSLIVDVQRLFNIAADRSAGNSPAA